VLFLITMILNRMNYLFAIMHSYSSYIWFHVTVSFNKNLSIAEKNCKLNSVRVAQRSISVQLTIRFSCRIEIARLLFKFQTLCEILSLNIGDRHSANCCRYERSFIPWTNAKVSIYRSILYFCTFETRAL